MTKGGVVQQVRLEVAQQVAHGQQRTKLGNLPGHLLRLEILYALESQLDASIELAVGQGIGHRQLQLR
ncbi:hypothetical protein D3C77_748020 [compost metagenome]